MGLLLLFSGIVSGVYSTWFQRILKDSIVEKINRKDGIHVEIDGFSLDFPLDVKLSGLTLTQNGDTTMAARSFEGEIALFALLSGNVDIRRASVLDGRYQIGNADSILCMKINAGNIYISPATVNLSTMDINLTYGKIDHAVVDMTIKQDTIPTPPSEKQELRISIGDLDLNDFTYKISLMPAIDSLGTTIGHASLHSGSIDLGSRHIGVQSFKGDNLSATFMSPDPATAAYVPEPTETPSDTASSPWTIEIDTISFTSSRALYTARGAKPSPGLDLSYISLDSLDLNITEFYNKASSISVPLSIRGTERCGVSLAVDGVFSMDSTAIRFGEMHLSTPATGIDFSGAIGTGDFSTDPDIPVNLMANGRIGVGDLRRMFPVTAPYMMTLPQDDAIKIGIDIDGSPERIDIRSVALNINHCVNIQGKGHISDIFDYDRLSGDIALKGNIIDFSSIGKAMIDPASGIKIPPMKLDGRVKMAYGTINGNLVATTYGGQLALDADWHSKKEGYSVNINTTDFPIDAFMPTLGIGRTSGIAIIDGHGYDIFSKDTEIEGHIALDKAECQGYVYSDIHADLSLHDGYAAIGLSSHTDDLDFNADASGNLDGDTYSWDVAIDGRHIDLHALNLSENPASIKINLDGSGKLSPGSDGISAEINLHSLDFKEDIGAFSITDVKARIDANDEVTNFSIRNRDLYTYMSAECPVDTLIGRFGLAIDIFDRQSASREIDMDEIQKALPPFILDLNAGNDNMLTHVLSESDMGFKRLSIEAYNDSIIGIDARMLSFHTGVTRLDTITFNLTQHDKHLQFNGAIDNRPGTLDQWAKVRMDGYFDTNRIGIHVSQHDIRQRQGFDIGANATLGDSSITVRFIPLNPMIGYKLWSINPDNYIYYNFAHRHFDANLRMQGDDSTLQLYTEHIGDHEHEGQGEEEQEEVVLKIDDIHLADWISINPFAPPVKGNLSADIRMNWDGTDINGHGSVGLDDLYYGKERVASLKTDIGLTTNKSGTVRAKADLFVDGSKTLTIEGNLNDSTMVSPFNLDFSLIRFPLETINPFLPTGTAKFTGTLNGKMDISGDASAPIFNGYLDFDSTAVNVAMTGTSYRFSEEKIPVTDNVITLKDFYIAGSNDNPLHMNGTVDIASLASPVIDINMSADNMQIINTTKAPRGAEIYGKAFIGLDADIKGDMRLLRVNASADILPGTNVTYIMTEATSAIASQSTGDMVKFVNFNDTTAAADKDKTVSSMMLMVSAVLNIHTGSTINVDLSANGKDKVQILSQGTLNYTVTPVTQSRLTGRININSGFVRYTPPFMSEKLFNFDQGSYISFNGDILNPLLNVHATDVLKANVTQEGQNSRLVDFDVHLGVTGSLSNMNVAFDLSTDDDITIANELQSMSAEQRANQAMNLLLYNVYTGPGTKGNANLSGNPLFSFLESQINTWAASTIKVVDITFGIDQYDRTTDGATTSAMSYSYKVSKTLFNDRFRIVIGGNYSTDANSDENFSQNLINDISFEYYLNNSQTMLVKIFRHTGYESILEGEITQTGVGFVYKRKLNRLSDMFGFARRKRGTSPSDQNPAPAPTTDEPITGNEQK